MDQMAIECEALDTATWTGQLAGGSVNDHEARTMCFGEFSLCPGARTLRLGDAAVPLGSRAFDLLVVLLRSRGRLVAKDEIVREVWPSTFVDESNLRFQMGVLRKALGPERDRIKTIPGRGYIFVDEEEGPSESDSLQIARPSDQISPLKEMAGSFILIVEPDAGERKAMTALLRALKISVLGFKSVEEVSAFTLAPARLATA